MPYLYWRDMKNFIFKVMIITGMILNSSSILAQSDHQSSSGQDYSVELYESEAESPEKYGTRSPYDGVMSTQSTQRMLEDIRRLNQMMSKTFNRELSQTNIELPKLSQVFGSKVLFRMLKGREENVVPEGVSIKELARAIVKELVKLRKEGKIPVGHGEKKEITFRGKGQGLPSQRGRRKSPLEDLRKENIYERDIKFEQGSVTITYLIFGKRVIIETPMILAENLKKKEARLKRELEYMATLIDEIGRQR